MPFLAHVKIVEIKGEEKNELVNIEVELEGPVNLESFLYAVYQKIRKHYDINTSYEIGAPTVSVETQDWEVGK